MTLVYAGDLEVTEYFNPSFLRTKRPLEKARRTNAHLFFFPEKNIFCSTDKQS